MSNEFMRKTYNFDPDNVLTRGLPVPPGYRPLAPGEEPREGDLWAIINEPEDFHAAMSLPFSTWPFQDPVLRMDCDIYFRRIEWSADLLARIPEGFEAYDRPGEPPESVEGWRHIDLGGVTEAQGMATGLKWWVYQLDEYGVTWCLARPIIAMPACVECGGVNGAHRDNCPYKVAQEPWVDTSVALPEGYEWARRGEPLGEGAMFWDPLTETWRRTEFRFDTPERWCTEGLVSRPLAVPKKPDAWTCAKCARETYSAHQRCSFCNWPRAGMAAAERPTLKPKIRCADCDAAVEMVDGQPMRVCACVDPEAERERHRAQFWRVVDHPSREERDARAIDNAIGRNPVKWTMARERKAFGLPVVLPPREDPKTASDLYHVGWDADSRRLEGWCFGDEPEPHDERLSVQVQHEDEV